MVLDLNASEGQEWIACTLILNERSHVIYDSVTIILNVRVDNIEDVYFCFLNKMHSSM